MKFSIVMPVYNTDKKYLKESILSVVNQTYKNWELIIVDDGSCLDTKKELNKYESSNIILKSIRNSGVSNARNIGTAMASGEYVLYLDSDDIISNSYLEDLNSILTYKKYDMILSQVTFKRELIASSKKINVLSGDDILKKLRKYYLSFVNKKFKTKDAWVNRGPVARCIKLEIAKDNLFDINLNFAEDVVWNLKLLNKHINLAVMLVPEYYYRKNIGSATQSYRKNYNKEIETILSKIKEIIQKFDLQNSQEYATACFEYYRIYLKLYLYLKENNLSKEEKYLDLVRISKYIKKEISTNRVIIRNSFKQKILYFLFKNNLYYLIHLIEMR